MSFLFFHFIILFLLLDELNFPEIVAMTEHWLNVNETILIKNYYTLNMSMDNNFVAVKKFEKLFEFPMVNNAINNLYIICIY